MDKPTAPKDLEVLAVQLLELLVLRVVLRALEVPLVPEVHRVLLVEVLADLDLKKKVKNKFVAKSNLEHSNFGVF